MKKIIPILLMVFSISVSGGSFLGTDTKIERIRVYEGHAVVFTESSINKASCATETNAFILTLEDGDFGNRKYSTLLTAFAAGKSFNPWCADQCWEKWSNQYTVCTEASVNQ